MIGELASKLGFEHISLSHKIIPMVRAVPRGITSEPRRHSAFLLLVFALCLTCGLSSLAFSACIDSYLTPCIKEYIRKFLSAFSSVPNNVLFMQSDGGLTSVNK